MVEATIEDLAFVFWSSRGVDGVDPRVCLSEASCAAARRPKGEWRLKSEREQEHS
ncbi:MAG: hypothetical protein GTO17_03195 [Candidatus Aminicenantes bacterium]|nr:hypothetical protein [Candidatus Aminicenantes bacterium]